MYNKKKSTDCNQHCQYIGFPSTVLIYERVRVLVRKALIDDAIQNVAPISLSTRIVNISQYSLLAGHPGESRKYNSLRRESHWSHTVRNLWTVVNNCTEHPRVSTEFIHQRKLELIPAAGHLEFVAVDILGQLLRTKADDYFVTIMTDRYTKLTWAWTTTKISSTQVINTFFNDSIAHYEIPDKVLSKNVQQFVSKFFTPLCSYLETIELKTKFFNPQINGQVEK